MPVERYDLVRRVDAEGDLAVRPIGLAVRVEEIGERVKFPRVEAECLPVRQGEVQPIGRGKR